MFSSIFNYFFQMKYLLAFTVFHFCLEQFLFLGFYCISRRLAKYNLYVYLLGRNMENMLFSFGQVPKKVRVGPCTGSKLVHGTKESHWQKSTKTKLNAHLKGKLALIVKQILLSTCQKQKLSYMWSCILVKAIFHYFVLITFLKQLYHADNNKCNRKQSTYCQG